ncbi:hypothetical protein CsSME_00019942 [Camellia sinensis var. sinensis]
MASMKVGSFGRGWWSTSTVCSVGVGGGVWASREVTGDPGKMVAVQRNLSKFGIREIARTGKIALRREKMGESAPFWRYSAASYPDLETTMPVDTSVWDIKRKRNEESDTSVRVCIYLNNASYCCPS